MTLKHFREVLQYVPSFRGETFVVAVDGNVVEGPNFHNLVLDIGVLRSLSINVVLVHGIGVQLDRRASQLGIEVPYFDGFNVTDDRTMDLVLSASAECMQRVLGTFSAAEQPCAVPNAVVARPTGIINGQDLANTGKILKVEQSSLRSLLDQQIIPVLSPIGFDHTGEPLRIHPNSLTVAAAVATQAKKIVFAASIDGIISDGDLIRQMTVQQARRVIENGNGNLTPKVLSKLQHASDACNEGIERAHIINGTTDEGLLAEVFSNEGIGTLVYADNYQTTRTAIPSDVGFIFSLVHDAASDDEVVARTREQIMATIDEHVLVEIDGNPVACAAMHSYPGQKIAELASFVVADGHRHFGIGSRLIDYVENKARQSGVTKLFCLSTQAFTYFREKAGFVDGGPSDLPPERRERWANNGRNSKILVKTLD